MNFSIFFNKAMLVFLVNIHCILVTPVFLSSDGPFLRLNNKENVTFIVSKPFLDFISKNEILKIHFRNPFFRPISLPNSAKNSTFKLLDFSYDQNIKKWDVKFFLENQNGNKTIKNDQSDSEIETSNNVIYLINNKIHQVENKTHQINKESIAFLMRHCTTRKSYNFPIFDNYLVTMDNLLEIRLSNLTRNFFFYKLNIPKNEWYLAGFSLSLNRSIRFFCMKAAIKQKQGNFNEDNDIKRLTTQFNNLNKVIDTIFEVQDRKLTNAPSLLQFICGVCQLSNSFFKFEFDSSPSDIFNKFIVLLQMVSESFECYEYNKTLTEMTPVFSFVPFLNSLLNQQYYHFMQIYRDQYRLMYLQFIYIQAPVDEKWAVERFLMVSAVYDVLHWLMTIVCNFDAILNEKNIIIFELNFNYLQSLEKNEEYPDKNKSGIVKAKNTDFVYILMKFTHSIAVLCQLPVEFYDGNKRIGIEEWNESYDEKMKRIENK